MADEVAEVAAKSTRGTPAQWWQLVKGAVSAWVDDYAPSMGAALSYYTVFSLAPLLLLVISIAGLVFGEEAARGEIFGQVAQLMGADAAKAIEGLLASVNKPAEGVAATTVGVVLLLIGATTVFGELQDDLNRIWKAEADTREGIWAQVRKRLLSFGLIVVIGFLLLTSLVVSAAISYAGDALGGNEAVARVLEMAASLAVMTILFGLTFKILPSRRPAWRDVVLGAFITAVLFSIGKYLIGLYIGKSAIASDFGAAGTVVVVIVWIYYSSQIFFFGAEFTRAYAVWRASRVTAANSDFGTESGEMVEVAKRIVASGVPPKPTPTT